MSTEMKLGFENTELVFDIRSTFTTKLIVAGAVVQINVTKRDDSTPTNGTTKRKRKPYTKKNGTAKAAKALASLAKAVTSDAPVMPGRPTVKKLTHKLSPKLRALRNQTLCLKVLLDQEGTKTSSTFIKAYLTANEENLSGDSVRAALKKLAADKCVKRTGHSIGTRYTLTAVGKRAAAKLSN